MFAAPVLNSCLLSFIFIHTATTTIYTLSLHDALPILPETMSSFDTRPRCARIACTNSTCIGVTGAKVACPPSPATARYSRSEEHTSELQSRRDLVCRLLLEKKKINQTDNYVLHALWIP